jgi:hypothetical protein
MLAAEHLLDLARLDLAIQPVQPGLQVIADVFSLTGPIDEYLEVAGLLLQGFRQVEIRLQPPTAAQDILCLFGTFPEIRCGRLGFQCGQFLSYV